MMETLFYVLVDPFSSEPMYVGKTHIGIEKRLNYHMKNEMLQKSSKWIHDLIRQGVAPIAYELDRIPRNADSRTVEQFWIQYFKFIGAELTNRQHNGTSHLKGRATRWTKQADRERLDELGVVHKIDLHGRAAFQISQKISTRGKVK